MALVYGNDDYEEEPPPPAFQINTMPDSVHIPTNSLMSVEAEVFGDLNKKKSMSPAAISPQINNNMNNNHMMMPKMNNNMNNNHMMMGGPMVNKQMMPPQNMNNRNSGVNMMGAKGGPNSGAMPFPILSEEFMNNMMNMDFSKMNANKHNSQNSIGSNVSISKPKLYNPQNQMPPPPKHNNMQYINDMIHQPQMAQNNNHNPLLSQQSAPQLMNNNGYGHKQQKSQISVQPIVKEPEVVDPIEGELVSMGFEKEYVVRACNLYKKKFKNKPLRLEVLTEIIIRLQQRDQSKKRSHSIDQIDNSPQKVAAAPKHQKKRSSFSGVQMKKLYKNEPLPQSVSQPSHYNNMHNQQPMIHHQHQSSAEQVIITLVMPSSSIGMQTAEIVMRRDQTLNDLKRLASTCLTDFDQFDESYAFFHDDSGFIFTEFDVNVTQALQLMDVDVNNADNINVIVKIGRVVSKYIKLKK